MAWNLDLSKLQTQSNASMAGAGTASGGTAQATPQTSTSGRTSSSPSAGSFGAAPNYTEVVPPSGSGMFAQVPQYSKFNPPPPPPMFGAAIQARPQVSDTPAAPPSGEDSINTFYDSLTKQQDADWDKQQGMLQGQMAGFQREADSLNARMGGSIAGGYAGLAGSGLTRGMDEFNKASLAYNQLRQATQRDQFNALTDERQRQEEHTWDEEARTEDREQQFIQMLIDSDVPLDAVQAYTAGGGGMDAAVAAINKQEEQDKADKRAEAERWLKYFQKKHDF